MNGLLVRVVAPHFVAGFVVADCVVDHAAPILAFMVGWPSERAREYLARKGWPASIVPARGDAMHGKARQRVDRLG